MPDLKFESAILKSYAPNPGATLALSDESDATKLLIRSDQEQFGLAFGHAAMLGDALVAATRPDEWLIIGSAEAVEEASSSINTGGFTSVIPFTHGRSLFRLTGEHAPSMMEKVCGIDWSDNMTPNGAVVSASVALTTCDIIRADLAVEAGTVRSYLLQCDRSFGQYLFDALIDAGDEFGIGVTA